MILKTFSASWCVPCKSQKPVIETWSKTHPEVKVETVSVESPEGAAMASKYFVQSVPYLVVLNESGTVLAAQGGVHDSRRLDALVQAAQRSSLNR